MRRLAYSAHPGMLMRSTASGDLDSHGLPMQVR